jgi:putative SOS response-associated peptidase YedK
MCGRFFLATPGPELARHFGLAAAPDLPARFNVAPGQPVPLVRVAAGSPGARELAAPRWGFVPAWSEDPGSGRRPINARAETVADSPLFRAALAQRRGLVPADGFYEWQHVGRSARPFVVRPRERGLLAMAAIFERWAHGGAELETCAILTVPAAGAVRPLHDRMPLFVAPADHARWLDPALQDAAALAPLLRGTGAEQLEVYPVDRRVNDVREDDAGLIEPERDLFSAGGAA